MDATWTITFAVPGPPVPQPRPKISTWGGRGRAYVEARHPIHAYRQAVELAAAASAGRANHKPSGGPVALLVEAVFERPPSHMNGGGTLRAGAPEYPPKCDWDNLGKGVCDAITASGAVWHDDSQVVDGRVVKRYSSGPADKARTIVTVRPYHGPPP